MPAHLKRRGKYFYIIDGGLRKSLKTGKRGIAEALLREYIRDQHGLMPTPTVREFYDRWIKSKQEPLVRRALIRDYQQAFARYILPTFGNVRLSDLGTAALVDFRNELLGRGLAVKTTRNIIDGSFRAMYRDARAEIESLQGRDPFLDIRWPRGKATRPDPFNIDNRDRIISWFADNEPYYYPFVRFQFETGARPSESVALEWGDLNSALSTVRIDKSRHLGIDSVTKTSKSRRVIQIPQELMDLIQACRLPIWGDRDKIFRSKFGGPLVADNFRKDYWGRCLDELQIPRRKFYCCRHTFITELVSEGYNLKAIADYCGTSVQMVEDNYCGILALPHRTELAQQSSNSVENMASPTGFEPVLSA